MITPPTFPYFRPLGGPAIQIPPFLPQPQPHPFYVFQPVQPLRPPYTAPDATPAPTPAPDSKVADDLRVSIRAFVECLEQVPEHTRPITLLSNRFGIKRRRLYDVINVFESVGACRKSGLDTVKWLGLDNMKETLKVLRKERHIDDPTIPLEQLFPAPCCVGISNLTTSFLLLFGAIKTNRVDLRFVSQFFSHGTARYKTTLCKLYQICYILGAIGVTKRTAQVCEVILSDEYCDPDARRYGDGTQDQGGKATPETSMSITALLNNSDGHKRAEDWLEARRKALESCYIENVSGMQV